MSEERGQGSFKVFAAAIKGCVIAGNISPIDVNMITHVPILCEEANMLYIYAPSKEDLANAGATKSLLCYGADHAH